MKPVFKIKNLKRNILANAIEVFSDDLDDWELENIQGAIQHESIFDVKEYIEEIEDENAYDGLMMAYYQQLVFNLTLNIASAKDRAIAYIHKHDKFFKDVLGELTEAIKEGKSLMPILDKIPEVKNSDWLPREADTLLLTLNVDGSKMLLEKINKDLSMICTKEFM